MEYLKLIADHKTLKMWILLIPYVYRIITMQPHCDELRNLIAIFIDLNTLFLEHRTQHQSHCRDLGGGVNQPHLRVT